MFVVCLQIIKNGTQKKVRSSRLQYEEKAEIQKR